MRTSQAIVVGLVLCLPVLAATGCSGLGSDYEPGIKNPGYTPGHGRTNYAGALAAAPSIDRLSPGNSNGAPARASGLGSGAG
jgi:hypothetical protein